MQKHSILVAWRGSEYSCIQVASNNVLCHHNKYLMGYFEFLYDSGIICLPLNIPEKLHWQQFFQKPKKADSLLGNTIPTHPEEQHLTFKQTGTTTIFSFGYQSCVWPRSHPFFRQNPCSGCNSGIDLLVALEYTLFQLCSNAKKFLLDWQDSEEAMHYCRSNQPHKLHSVFAWCALHYSEWPCCSYLSLMLVYLYDLFLLSTPLARMLLTPRWVSRRKDVK